MVIDLKQAEKLVCDGLKDFQLATVERVVSLFKKGQNRVLVADEVGLGKTLVAKGVIAKIARYHQEKSQGDLFKVVYICSNQNIANQNISKLKINSEVTVDGVTDTRLSMQHLKICEQENNQVIKDRYIQLIPLTPSTSFTMTSGCGSVEERALIFAVLKRLPLFKDYIDELEVIMIDWAATSWRTRVKAEYEVRVVTCDRVSCGTYIQNLTKAINEYWEDINLAAELLTICKKVRENGKERMDGTYLVLNQLRMMFAQISVDLLNPDLVIMDEFQRFKYLIAGDVSNEAGMLAERFLKGNNSKILLLSATPYKLYSTLEEINEKQSDEHYSEFLQVMKFLLVCPEQQQAFKEVWSNFSVKLSEISIGDLSIIEVKNNAEDALYQGICRTERMAAVQMGDFIEDKSVKTPLKITENDILSYIETEILLKGTGYGGNVPVEYIKSAPYILSFMKQYKIKEHIEKYFKKKPDELRKANKKHLWLDHNAIKNYGELGATNARLERLKECAFDKKAELLLWIPPSQPYYEQQGVFKNTNHFSKILVFSAWEMVPRMIATLISYEAERKTVGKLAAQNTNKQNITYFSPNNKRYPVARLRFNISDNEPKAMSLFCLLYPSAKLASLYNPIECLNKGMSLKDIEKDLGRKIATLLSAYQGTGRVDERWYYLAPLLLDNREYVEFWLRNVVDSDADDEEERGQKGYKLHLERLEEYYRQINDNKLGRMPADLVKILTHIAIASPAVCAYRTNGENSVLSSQLAKVMLNRFNMPESTAIIELCYGKTNDEAHWKNVLRYFKDGNFQAVIDEYVHIISDSNSLSHADNKHEFIQKTMLEALGTHSASYNLDTFTTFKNSIIRKKERGISLRSHYAVGFYKGEGDNSKLVNRKESIRTSFNSPFRPFVLATTSIGQEGLDFHYYCRKIMHWNLPSNPIDLEQREGRINRFKCLAIRQNIALLHGHTGNFHEDVWHELFDRAKAENVAGQSELIPFWCLPDHQNIKIERIVPVYPLSKDIGSYERLIKILSLYRLTLGQARQEELLEYLFKNCEDSSRLKELFINLSPYYKESGAPNC